MESSLMDSLFFYASKLFWSFASPDNLLLFLLTLAIGRVLLFSTSSGSSFNRSIFRRSPSKKLLALALTCLWLVALLPMGNWLLYPLEKRYDSLQLPADASAFAGAIVLGGPVKLQSSQYWGGLEVKATAERVMTLVELQKRYPQLPIIFTGGSGNATDQGFREADFVQRYMHKLGVEKGIYYERESRNTFENALYSKELISDLVGTDERPWLLVTSAFHMSRSVGVFQQQSVPVVPYPVDHWSLPPRFPYVHFDLSGNLADLNMGVREWIGLVAYRLTGKTETLLGDTALVPAVNPALTPIPQHEPITENSTAP